MLCPIESTVHATMLSLIIFLCASSSFLSCQAKSSNSNACGTVKVNIPVRGRIVGGKEAPAHAWPWMVDFAKGSTKRQHCGGVVIAPEWVATAGHCVGSAITEYTVTVGGHNRYHLEGTEQVMGVKKIIRHEHYGKGFSVSNDIALLQLNGTLKYNDYVQPICLPSVEANTEDVCYATGLGVTKGYGHEGATPTEVLMELRVPVINQTLCFTYLNKRFGIPEAYIPGMMCAGYLEGKRDTCQGDSGGPFVCKNSAKKKTQWVLHGLVSFGPSGPCANQNEYGVYTKVVNYVDWIRKQGVPS